ncbi:MAG: hypothetical protein SH868_14825 [Bythopirellula sp.]|nr:hypothetical protein [Bythopirellula sp.]
MFLRFVYSLICVISAVSLSGCAPLCCCTDRCGCAIESAFGCDSYCGCGDPVCCGASCCKLGYGGCGPHGCGGFDCGICRGGGLCPLALRHRELRIAVGPPAVRHQPEMPPEFLPVPTQPINANVNMNAPTEVRGAVDAGWGSYFTVQGRD